MQAERVLTSTQEIIILISFFIGKAPFAKTVMEVLCHFIFSALGKWIQRRKELSEDLLML